MSVYVDKMLKTNGQFYGSHMVADSEKELHAFAKKIGLKREWYQNEGKRNAHYDLTTNRMFWQAIKAGALLVTSKSLVGLKNGR